MSDIPFITQYGEYWVCKCNKVIHDKSLINEHNHIHAIQTIYSRYGVITRGRYYA